MLKKTKYRRALVTGGAGFIGSHIVEGLLGIGIETVVLDNFSVGKKENVPKGAVIVEGDMLDEGLLKRVTKGADIVFHNAALVSIRNSFDNFYNDVRTNVLGTAVLLKAMVYNKVKKIIYASSMAVYANKTQLPIREDSLLNPISPYGVSKLTSERYCLLMSRQYGFDAICLRYFNTYGPRQTLTPYVGAITIFINRLLHNKPPIIFGNGNQVRDFIYVKDVARANILAMESEVKNGVFNIGTGRGTSINRITKLLIKRISPLLKPVYVPPRVEEPKNSVADITRARKALEFSPKFQIEDKIDEIIEWWTRIKR